MNRFENFMLPQPCGPLRQFHIIDRYFQFLALFHNFFFNFEITSR